MTRTGGQVLVDQLRIHGASLAFCIPGESYLGVLDALYDARDSVRLITCRHEGAACNAAAAFGRLSGRPGICLVTRGPGASHAAVGVHTAEQDSSPLLLVVGQVPRSDLGRGSFQEIDYRAMFGRIAKWVEQVDDPRRIPELVARAFRVATEGRPGPVVLALPEDVVEERCEVEDAPAWTVAEDSPDPARVDEVAALMTRAERPLVMVGGTGWSAAACADLRSWSERSSLPVAASFRQHDILDNRSPSYVGGLGSAISPELSMRLKEADVLLALGTRLDTITAGRYRLIVPPRPRQTLIHVHASAAELGRVFQPELGVVARPGPMLRALLERGLDGSRWASRTREARAQYLADRQPTVQPGQVSLGEVILELRLQLPDDAVVTNGAGNFTGWLQRHFEFRTYPSQLGPTSGAMGYGLPAALAACAAMPGRRVCCVAGDGDFLMYASELATAVQEALPVLVIVVDNAMYGTIRMHQQQDHPGRVIATDLRNPDWAALASSFGVYGQTVTSTADFGPALERALSAPGPALVAVKASQEAISARS